MEPTRFDDFTKVLATPTTRRQALQRIGGAVAGGLLAILVPGRVLASNSTCAKFCNAVFGADTPAAMQCISDATHHKGLCYTCGPASPGGTQSICCTTNASGFCTSYSSATCCALGQTCCNGTCSDCPCGQVKLNNGTCATPCGPACNVTLCPSSCSGCYCTPNLCGGVETGTSCSNDNDCPSGQFCNTFDGHCVVAC